MLNSKTQRITLTHIGLTLVGLMWVFPFLHYRHQYPLTTFDQEWWCALLGVLAISLLATRDGVRRIPRVVQLPVALMGVVLLQMALGMMAYAVQGLLYLLYLLFAALLIMLGARLRDSVGLEKLATVLASFLVLGAALSALIGLIQHYHWHSPLDVLVVRQLDANIYGNLAQRNHFANYIALGLISLGLLLQQRRVRPAYAALLAIPLLFVLTLSGSRSSWLYLLLMSALAWWGARRLPELRPLLRYCLLLLAGFAVMHLLVRLPVLAGAADVNTLQRFSGADAFGGIRLSLWREAWLMFVQSPWLGSGMGQFAWQHFQLGPLLHRTLISGMYSHAHNLVFQVAAEAGIAGLAALFVPLGVWMFGLRRASLSAAHWWAYALLGVLAIHSLLEYPLWYGYFLAVAAVLLGAFDEMPFRLALRSAGRVAVIALVLAGLSLLWQLRSSYQQMKLEMKPGSAVVMPVQENRLASGGLLIPYQELFRSGRMAVSTESIQSKLALNTRALHFMPTAGVAYRQAWLLAQAGQPEQARLAYEQAFWSYPSNPDAKKQLRKLADKDPAHFSALLEFALQKEQEYLSAIHNQ